MSERQNVLHGENATKVLNSILEQAFIPFLAKALYNAGYRKASDVALEVIGEIEALANKHMSILNVLEVLNILAERKKKYTEEKKDV